jgi:transcriptional regulator with XRE-family HTH domain
MKKDKTKLQNPNAFDEFRKQALTNPETRKRFLNIQAELAQSPRARMSKPAPSARMGMILRAARVSRGKTQAQQALLTGIGQSEISRLESGGGALGPSMETIVTYAHGMDYDVVVLLKPRENDLSEEMVKSFDILDAAREDVQSAPLWDVF